MTVTELKRKLDALERLGYGDKCIKFEVEGLHYSPSPDNAIILHHEEPLICEFDEPEEAQEYAYVIKENGRYV